MNELPENNVTSLEPQRSSPGYRPQLRRVFERQLLHWLSLGLLSISVGVAYQHLAGAHAGSWLGISTGVWFVIAILVPIAHQHWVLLGWRLELHLGWWSRRFGKDAFTWFSLGFEVLILGRVLSIVAVAIANRGTVDIPPLVQVPLIFALMGLFVWLMASVVLYFNFARARGADHFFEKYRHLPLCREGIFRFIPNAIYTVGFSPLWALAFAFESTAVFLATTFTQIYIWIHYFCTEVPDMDHIYSRKENLKT